MEDLSEYIKKACPYEEFPYEEQLEKKFKRICEEVDWFMEHKFDKFPKAKIHDCVPADKTDHYVNTWTVTLVREEGDESKIEAGCRIRINKFRNPAKIVPLKELIFVPRQFTNLVEDFVEWCMTPDGLVVSVATKVNETSKVIGHVVGLTLQMSSNEEIVMTILVRVPSNEGDNKNSCTTLAAISQKMLDEFKDKGSQFLEDVGSKSNVKAVYLKGLSTGPMFSKDSEVLLLAGEDVEEPLNSDLGLYVEPRCQWSASNRGEAILIERIVHLSEMDSNSVVFTSASSLKYIPYIFAQKAKEVVAIFHGQTSEVVESMSDSIKMELKARHNLENVEVVEEYKSSEHASKLKEAILVVWGPLQKYENVRQMLKDGVKKVFFVNIKEAGLMRILKHFGLEGYMPTEVVPVDVMPHTMQFGVVISFAKAPGVEGQPLDRQPSPTPHKFSGDQGSKDGRQRQNPRFNKRRGSQLRSQEMMGPRGPKMRRTEAPGNNFQHAPMFRGRGRGGGPMGGGPMGMGRRQFPSGPRPEPIPLMDLILGKKDHQAPPLMPPPVNPLIAAAPQQPLAQVQQVLNLLTVAQQLAMVQQQNQAEGIGGSLNSSLQLLQQPQGLGPSMPMQSSAMPPNRGNMNSNWSDEPPKPLIPNLNSSSGSNQWSRRGVKPPFGGGVKPEGNPYGMVSSSNKAGGGLDKPSGMKGKFNNNGPRNFKRPSPKPLLPSADKDWWKQDYSTPMKDDSQMQNVNRSKNTPMFSRRNTGGSQEWKPRYSQDQDRNGQASDRPWNAQKGRVEGDNRWNDRGAAGGQQQGKWFERRNMRR